jgi:hypothetical protein
MRGRYNNSTNVLWVQFSLQQRNRCLPFLDVSFFFTLQLPQCGHFTGANTMIIPPVFDLTAYIITVFTLIQRFSPTTKNWLEILCKASVGLIGKRIFWYNMGLEVKNGIIF